MIKYVIKNISDMPDEEYKKSFFCMNDSRKAKIKRFKGETSKKCTLAGEWLTRELLCEITGNSPESFDIFADENGKLHCKNSPLHFNISHSENIVAVAVSDSVVGVDIEVIRPVSLKLSKKLCIEEELLYIFGHTPTESDFCDDKNPEYLRRFFEIWTIKEAYFKCIGTGITGFDKINSLSDSFKKTKIENENYIMHIVTDVS